MKDVLLFIIFHPVTEIITLTALGLFFAGFKKYKKLFKELLDIPQKVMSAKDSKSAGGENITTEE